MKILSKEKTKVLAERNGWTLERAEGFIDGEMFRRRGKAPSVYARVGIDEYCHGFRAGYYERQEGERNGKIAADALPGRPAELVSLARPREQAELPVDSPSAVVSIQGG